MSEFGKAPEKNVIDLILGYINKIRFDLKYL